jgi:glutathione peroxidase
MRNTPGADATRLNLFNGRIRMKSVISAFTIAMLGGLTACGADKPQGDKTVAAPLEQKTTAIDGKEMNLADHKGKVVLFVNVASKCGYTSQYTGMQALYEKYKDKGFVLIGVPSNDFGAQEKGTNEEIAKFCSTKYQVTFPMLAKQTVKGEGKSELYQSLTAGDVKPKGKGEISWNFEKILVDKKGEVVGRYASKVTPDSDELTKAIEAALAAK